MNPIQPLAGRRVVVTRTREQASALAARLATLGAEVVELPVVRITKEIAKTALADVMLELGSYDWIVFTSANGVRFFFEEFFRLFDDIRSLGLLRIACVGDGTASAILELRLKVDIRPPTATAEALAEALIGTDGLDSAKMLVITGNLNRDTLVKKLEGARAIVDCFQVYKTEKINVADSPEAVDFCARGADAILFASSSSAESFVEQALILSDEARRPLAGSIGPQTSAAMKKSGMTVDFEALNPGIDELVEALVRKMGR